MPVAQTAFSVLTKAIGTFCFVVVAAIVYFALTGPQALEAALPQIVEAINIIARNAQDLIMTARTKIN